MVMKTIEIYFKGLGFCAILKLKDFISTLFIICISAKFEADALLRSVTLRMEYSRCQAPGL